MKPAKSILDPTFEYIDAAKSDIRIRFEAIKRERAKADAAESERLAKLRASVKPIGMRAVK